MSQKRPPKRSRSSFGETKSQYSPGNEHLKPKRYKFEEHAESTDESSVRRSTRAPKPKLFDDEYFDSHSSSFEDNESRGKKDRTLSPTKQPNNSMLFSSHSTQLTQVSDSSADSCRRKSSRPPKPKVFDEDFIDSPKSKVDSKASGKEIEAQTELNAQKYQKLSSHKNKGDRKEMITGKSSQKEKATLVYIKDKQITPKVKENTKSFTSKMLGYYGDSSLQEGSSYSGEEEQVLAGNKAESSKVRHSSRTPKPKKTFALVEDASFVECSRENSDEEVPSNELISSKSSALKSTKSQRHSRMADFSGQGDTGRFDFTEEKSSTTEYLRQNEASKIDNSDKKSKKKPSKNAKPIKLERSQDLIVDVVGVEIKEKEDKKNVKEMNKKSLTKSKDIGKDSGKKKLKIEESSVLKIDKTKSKNKPKKTEKPEHPVGVIKIPQENSSSMLSSNENSKKTQLKHTKSNPNKPLCETKNKDKHIILKLHLPPHTESSSHSHSHKKHKHKHHYMDNKSEKSSGSKAKKQKLSMDNSSLSEETRKKVSIKFKGFSSSEPDVEVGEESTFSLPSSGQITKEPEVKKKKSKKHSHGETLAVPSTEQEHVKVIIKKNKKEIRVVEGENKEKLADKTQTKDSKSKPKVPKVDSKESELKKPKCLPKKKSKGGNTPSKSPNDKEKRKVITGYLMFCKSKRSQIAEANPGLEFPQISQKVGEAWNNLSEEEKQKWKEKANIIKAKLNINTVEKKPEKKAEVVKVGPDVVDMAAHLKLLGESLSLIGASLMAQRGTEVHGSLSVLLDSILCAICPLTFLTSHIPGIPGVSKENQIKILDDLAYTMPGLG